RAADCLAGAAESLAVTGASGQSAARPERLRQYTPHVSIRFPEYAIQTRNDMTDLAAQTFSVDVPVRVLMLTKDWPSPGQPWRAPFIFQQYKFLAAAGAD